jgi:ABC-type sugar transport system permease subunit
LNGEGRDDSLNGFSFIAPLLVLMVVAFNLPIVYMLGLAFWEKGRASRSSTMKAWPKRRSICACWATRCASR